MLTLAMLQRRWPHGNKRVPGLVEGIAEAAPAAFSKYGLNSPLTIAHAMAQFSHECGAGWEMVENLNYSAGGLMRTWPNRYNAQRAAEYAHQPEQIADFSYNGRLGNRLGSDDGWNYRGRGLAQTTGRDAYSKMANALGLDLLNHPDLVIDPRHALECGVSDFVRCGCLPYAERDDIYGVTRHLNGGYIGLTERKVWLATWKRELL